MKTLRHGAEFLFLFLIFNAFRMLPLDIASAAGGWLGRCIGPFLGAHRIAQRNLTRALPELPEAERRRILAGMWDNLGRVFAEYPHLEEICKNRVAIVHPEILLDALQAGSGGLFISGHLANWEISCATPMVQYGKEVEITYRAPNNPYTDALLIRTRSLGRRIRHHTKSREGGRSMMAALKQGRVLGMLIDQKYNEGLAVPFFGQPAMTNPVFVQMAQRYNGFLIPARAERLGGAHFRLTLHPPLALADQAGHPRTAEDVLAEAHRLLEEWIRERPEQWLWIHKRWDSKNLAAEISSES